MIHVVCETNDLAESFYQYLTAMVEENGVDSQITLDGGHFFCDQRHRKANILICTDALVFVNLWQVEMIPWEHQLRLVSARHGDASSVSWSGVICDIFGNRSADAGGGTPLYTIENYYIKWDDDLDEYHEADMAGGLTWWEKVGDVMNI